MRFEFFFYQLFITIFFLRNQVKYLLRCGNDVFTCNSEFRSYVAMVKFYSLCLSVIGSQYNGSPDRSVQAEGPATDGIISSWWRVNGGVFMVVVSIAGAFASLAR